MLMPAISVYHFNGNDPIAAADFIGQNWICPTVRGIPLEPRLIFM